MARSTGDLVMMIVNSVSIMSPVLSDADRGTMQHKHLRLTGNLKFL